MAEYNNLQKALMMIMDEKVREYEEAAKAAPHEFSRKFEIKMQKLIADQTRDKSSNQSEGNRNYKPARVKFFGRSMRRSVAVLLAAVLILAMTATAMAIVRPDIFFMIKDKLTNWDITPVQEGEENTSQEFTPIKPKAPEGYIISEENLTVASYQVTFTDESGHTIRYKQSRSSGLSIAVDSEGHDIYKTEINGFDAVISRHDEVETTLVVEDGNFVYIINGTCPLNIIVGLAEEVTGK